MMSYTVRRRVGSSLLFLLVLTCMLDPTNSVLGLKNPVFVICVAYNAVFMRPNLRFLPHILAVYAAVILSYVVAEMQLQVIDYDFLLAQAKGFSMLVLLLWIHHYNVVRLSIAPALLLCLVSITLFVIASSSDLAEAGLYLYMHEHDDMMMMAHRYFFGVKVFVMYFKSIITVVLPMFVVFYSYLDGHRRNVAYLLAVLLLFVAFTTSGTRSSMLVAYVIFGVAAWQVVSRRKGVKYFVYPLLGVLALCLLMLILALATEKGETSNSVKYGHLVSYAQLFWDHPQYLLWGQGGGTSFYSVGFHRMTNITEWSYLELLRTYGLGALLILSVVLLPLWRMWPHRTDNYTAGLLFSYVVYLFIAGTNPLMIGSTGMLVVLMAYSYIARPPIAPIPLCSKPAE